MASVARSVSATLDGSGDPGAHGARLDASRRPVAPVRRPIPSTNGTKMRVAGPIVLGVLGAILAFAVTADVAGVSLQMVGMIMLGAALVWFLIELVNGATGRKAETVTTRQNADGTVEQVRTETHANELDA